MATPANLHPGLNEISDALEELPIEVSRYMTLLREIDAKCVHTVPELNANIDGFLKRQDGNDPLAAINGLFQDLMPSLEEKMHVSAIAYEALQRLTQRLELAYEVAIKNGEIPAKLRLGVDNHPAMHLHHELMAKIDSKANSKSSQALRSESRREAMAAKRHTAAVAAPVHHNSPATTNAQAPSDGRKRRAHTVATAAASASLAASSAHGSSTAAVAGSAVVAQAADTPDAKKRKRKLSPKDADPHAPRTNEYGEALYCYCNQVAYGEMVGCDGDNCTLEWFHLPCIGLETLPKGKWYCDDCRKML
ncbi:LAFE_0F06722g1_1 [Lachancea fermentati]|uniref:Chromatin modification-related protein n=1 Tax=Lachancea fermentati TaxID=4955 RepID=A0A1G4MF85_LACFM|nr:LAFE_0F06722g1_1 [Lachancea fermentati]